MRMKKMTNIGFECLDRMEIEGVNSTIGKECYALLASYNKHMKQLFGEHKDAIDHILYGKRGRRGYEYKRWD
jgi:hypothetical protein